MIHYFDTSALVKRYALGELNAQLVLAFFANAVPVYTSALTQVEMISAFCIKERTNQFSKLELQTAIQDYEAHSPTNYILLQPLATTYSLAKSIVLLYQLRAYDALHIAAAIELFREVKNEQPDITIKDIEFYTADQDQATAAKAEGLTVILL
jgi:predicted nucleic acid-binding protein